ncbi:hypothetical protein [Actinomadura sp. WAC 06369]|uniref:hypothetical protein n=1 Tax=Actinomadura sp. WAC 06369 TaxID=2203193 RepID=UPI000F77848B|nr:hypothetical protein [Actinomadura sp. WAC 06369]RSN71212.1 hypothetical protein DMH08_03555 [Actinomadura sp. WAC 06369]
MTTDPHDDHGEILRRVLNAEAESVTPSDDGLERIRARIAAEGGRRRRFPGRFGPARFGPAGLTVGWARPVLAVAAAVAIAGFGVTAGPQTIDLIQHTVNGDGPSRGGGDDTDGDRTGANPPPVVPGDPSSPAPTTSTAPSTSEEAGEPSSSPGLSSCVIPRGGTAPSGTPSPDTTPTSAPSGGTQCPGGHTPTTSPTDPPPSTPTPPDPSPEPSDEQTPTPSDTPSTTKQQDAGQAGP